MKIRFLRCKLGAGILGSMLVLGVGFALCTTAQAQSQDDQEHRGRDRDRDRDRNRGGRNVDGYPNYGGSFELRQTALNAGYNDGIKDGRDDRKHGRRYEFRDKSSYQKATRDYNSRLGDRELYRRYFRLAFENGYKAGFNGY
jgi:hypothetical protein